MKEAEKKQLQKGFGRGSKHVTLSTGSHTGVKALSSCAHTGRARAAHQHGLEVRAGGLRHTARAGGQHTWAHRSYRSPTATHLRNEGELKQKDTPKAGFKLYFCPRYNCQLKAWLELQAKRQEKSWWGIIIV